MSEDNNNNKKKTGEEDTRLLLTTVMAASGTTHCPSDYDGDLPKTVSKIKQEQREILDYYSKLRPRQDAITIDCSSSAFESASTSGASTAVAKRQSDDASRPSINPPQPKKRSVTFAERIEEKEQELDDMSILRYRSRENCTSTKNKPSQEDQSSDEEEGDSSPKKSPAPYFHHLNLLWYPVAEPDNDYVKALMNDYCRFCNKKNKRCSNRVFGMYCEYVVELQRVSSPVEMMKNKKMVMDLYVKAYNRAFKFFKYRKSKRTLVLDGTYYPPQCMMYRINHLIKDLENVEMEIINKNETLDSLYDNVRKQRLLNKKLRDKGLEASNTSLDNVCEHCHEDGECCHDKMYSDYIAHRISQLVGLYPCAFDGATTSKIYVRLYNSAKHFVEFKKNGRVVPSTLDFPPECMKTNMTEVIDEVIYSHKYYIQDMETHELMDWKGSTMNLNGLVPFDDFI